MSALIVATPSRAYASDGFLGGLQDLVGAREVESVQDYESDYIKEYNPDLGAVEPLVRDVGSDDETVDLLPTVDSVNTTVNDIYRKNWFGTSSRTWLASLQFLLTSVYYAGFIPLAAGLVFMWWGVRKCIQVVMSGFRKGSLNV